MQETLKNEASAFKALLEQKDVKIKNLQAVVDSLTREVKAETEKNQNII